LSDIVPTPEQPNHDAPLMSTRRIRLRVITDRDSVFLYELMTSPRSGGRVRFAGATPSPDKIASSLWESVLAQFVIEGINSQKPLGLVAITSPNFRDGFAYISALGPAEAQGLGLIAEGVLLGFHYAFSTWPFRKIYMEATEESYRAFKSGLGRFFVEEGRLKEHSFWNGRFMDLLILAVYRETWAHHTSTMLKRFHPGS
jgi:RimJ/RimL family protein N-acetyltransferase